MNAATARNAVSAPSILVDQCVSLINKAKGTRRKSATEAVLYSLEILTSDQELSAEDKLAILKAIKSLGWKMSNWNDGRVEVLRSLDNLNIIKLLFTDFDVDPSTGFDENGIFHGHLTGQIIEMLNEKGLAKKVVISVEETEDNSSLDHASTMKIPYGSLMPQIVIAEHGNPLNNLNLAFGWLESELIVNLDATGHTGVADINFDKPFKRTTRPGLAVPFLSINDMLKYPQGVRVEWSKGNESEPPKLMSIRPTH